MGEVQNRCNYGGRGEWDQEDEAGGEVGAVSAQTQCHGCGGLGHMKRECPSAQAAKGFKGKGKGKGLGSEWGKGGSYLGKGAAKGNQFGTAKGGAKGSFKGACFACGKVGHRAADCQRDKPTLWRREAEKRSKRFSLEASGMLGLWTR